MEEATEPLKTRPEALSTAEPTNPRPVSLIFPPVTEIEINVLDDILHDQGPDPFSTDSREEECYQTERPTARVAKLQSTSQVCGRQSEDTDEGGPEVEVGGESGDSKAEVHPCS